MLSGVEAYMIQRCNYLPFDMSASTQNAQGDVLNNKRIIIKANKKS